MDILFVTQTVDENTEVGALVAALPKAFRNRDHGVTVVSPLYKHIDPTQRALARRLSKVDVTVGGTTYSCMLFDGRTSRGVQLLFIGHDELFGRVDSMGPEGEAESALRAGVFADAVAALVKASEKAYAAVHAFDWPGALALVALSADEKSATAKSVLTLHEPGSQGRFDKKDQASLGSAAERLTIVDGKVNVVASAIRVASSVTTPSLGVARSMTTEPAGHGLGTAFSELGTKLRGVSSGLDAAVWNPLTDPIPTSRFDPMDMAGKEACKKDWQRALALPVRADVPLLGAVATADTADGFDVLLSVLPDILRNDCQVGIVWNGDENAPQLAEIKEIAGRFSDRLGVVVNTTDGAALHRAVAGADLFVVPSRRTHALTHLLAQRYGALPIVPGTGGFVDAVVDCDSGLVTGTGFVFEELTGEATLAAVRRAFAAYTKGEAFAGRQSHAMRVDHSWDRSARVYESLYSPPTV